MRKFNIPNCKQTQTHYVCTHKRGKLSSVKKWFANILHMADRLLWHWARLNKLYKNSFNTNLFFLFFLYIHTYIKHLCKKFVTSMTNLSIDLIQRFPIKHIKIIQWSFQTKIQLISVSDDTLIDPTLCIIIWTD